MNQGGCSLGDNLPGYLPIEKTTTLIRRAGGHTGGIGSWGPSAVLAVTLLVARSWGVLGGVLGQEWGYEAGAGKGKASGVCQARGKGMGKRGGMNGTGKRDGGGVRRAGTEERAHLDEQ